MDNVSVDMDLNPDDSLTDVYAVRHECPWDHAQMYEVRSGRRAWPIGSDRRRSVAVRPGAVAPWAGKNV